MPVVKLLPCASCRSENIHEVRCYKWKCFDCGMTGSDRDVWGDKWNKIQILLRKDKGIDLTS